MMPAHRAPADRAPVDSDTETPERWSLNQVAAIERAHDGDRTAFEQLVTTNLRDVFRLSFFMLNSRSCAEDIVHETFSVAWSKLHSIATPGEFQLWVLRYSTSRCLELAGDGTSGDTASVAGDEPSAAGEQYAVLMQRLSPRRRAHRLLRELDLLSETQISRMLPASAASGSTVGARARLEPAGAASPCRTEPGMASIRNHLTIRRHIRKTR